MKWDGKCVLESLAADHDSSFLVHLRKAFGNILVQTLCYCRVKSYSTTDRKCMDSNFFRRSRDIVSRRKLHEL